MNRNRLFWPLGLLALSACTQAPQLAPLLPPPADGATAPPQPLATAPALPAPDPAAFAQAQANLKALGYAAGKGNDPADPAFQRALASFQRDQGLAEDGHLSLLVIEKLRLLRAQLRTTAPAPPAAVFVYSGRSARTPLTLTSPPEGFVSDAPANFLMPLRVGNQSVLHLTRKNAAPLLVTCRVGKIGIGNLPLGNFETVAVDCRGQEAGDPQWRDLFSPKLGVVLQRRSGAATRDLIAIRPVTGAWPAAVRTGLDWALSHALDEGAPSASLQWSSTAVASRFDIKVTARIKGAEVGLGGATGAASCRRFELVQAGAKAGYSGLACQNAAGDWLLPGSGVSIARPAGHAAGHGTTLRSAAK